MRILRVTLLSVASVLAVSAARAQTPQEVPHCADASTNRILALDFDGRAATPVNTDPGALRQLAGLAARDDVRAVSLVALDPSAGRILFYGSGGGVGQTVARARRPRGLSIDSRGVLYFVTSQLRTSTVWRLPLGGTLPGGYRSPQAVDAGVPSRLLGETLAVSFELGRLRPGDLLVASEAPPRIFRFPASGAAFGPRETFVPASGLSGDVPTGMAFSPEGELLVGTRSGSLLRFDATGARLVPDLLTGLGGPVEIATGVQGGENRLFVAAAGTARRFRLVGDGTIEAQGAFAACGKAAGMSIGTAHATPTPAGDDVEIRPLPEMELAFDEVTRPGATTARILEFKDNRPPGTSQSLRAFFPDDPVLAALLPDVTVPAHLQAFRKRDRNDPAGRPYSGPPTFILAIIDTTAGFRRTVEVHEDERDRLGYEPSCSDPAPAFRPRTFYVPEVGAPKNEPGIVEGPVFTDFSTGCGSNIGRGSRFSLWLTGRDTRAPDAIVTDKLANMEAALDSYVGIVDPALFAALQGQIAAAQDASGAGDYPATLSALDLFTALIDGSPTGFGADPDNAAGELIARSDSAEFMVGEIAPPSGLDVRVGDNDGYGFGAGVVPDGGTLPSTSFDNRSGSESGAADGAQKTDLMPVLPPPPFTQSFDVLLPFPGTLTSGTFEFDMGGRGQFIGTFTRFELSLNGRLKGQVDLMDDPDGTTVLTVPLDATDLANVNAAGQLVATFTATYTDGVDHVSFDYFRLTGTTGFGGRPAGRRR